MARRPAAGRPQAGPERPVYVSVPIEIGPVPAQESLMSGALALASPSQLAPDSARQFQTQVAYRQLITNGISGQEAAGLISYVVGLAPCESHWSLVQVNRLLFLRNLYLNSEWGKAERARAGKFD
jgi:hypothetical protein